MKIIVEEPARKLGILNPVAYLLHGIELKDNNYEELDNEKSLVISFIRKNKFEILKKSEVIGFRNLFHQLGYEGQKPAGERLLESFYLNGFKSINNIVDAYNITSLYHAYGIGMHDARNIDNIVITVAKGGEKILPIFKSSYQNVKQGDLIYKTDEKLLAWIGKKDVDSDEFKLRKETTNAVIIALGNSLTSKDYNNSICLETIKLIQKTCENLSYEIIETVPILSNSYSWRKND